MTSNEIQKTLEDLLLLPAETEVVEFKTASNDFHFDKIGKYFSALSNEANLAERPHAWLVFGVSDDKKIVGTKYRVENRASLDSLKGEVANKTSNRITFREIYETGDDSLRVVMFEIPAAPRGFPIAWDGHYYGRDAGELVPLNLEEIERIRRQATRTDWSAGICSEATIEDLDQDAIGIARANFKIKNPKLADEIDQWDTVTFLNKAKICINGKITKAAIILLGKPESEHFLTPGLARISWILKDKDDKELDYEHFSCPLILSVDKIFGKIRNLKYRYMRDPESLFPEEVDQYDPSSIREALNNCIAHQNYSLAGKINVVEHDAGQLTFTNLGDFLPGSVENVITSDSPPERYQNNFLSNAMLSLNMIDTVGSGIKRMFRLQKERLFPMPDYELAAQKVKVTLIGKVLDMDYARILVRNPNLTLPEIMMLDKVQRKRPLSEDEIRHLKGHGLIEGRKPNFHLSLTVAQKIGQKASYIKNKGVKDQYYKNMVLELIGDDGHASKEEIYNLLFDILPSVLTDEQKENKIRNLVYAMSKRDQSITNKGTNRQPKWARLPLNS